MENEQKKKQNSKVDEALIMAVIAEGTRNPNQPETPKEPAEEHAKEVTVARETARRKKTSDVGYGERFLSSHTMTRRGDKSIYIRQEHHERLSRIVQVIGEDKIPLYAYLDNIIEHHFEQFEKAITEDFNDKYKPLF